MRVGRSALTASNGVGSKMRSSRSGASITPVEPRAAASSGPGLPKYQPLPERRPDGAGAIEMRLVLDPLGQDDGAGPLRLRVDGVDDLGDLAARVIVDQAEIELDHLRVEEWQQRK